MIQVHKYYLPPTALIPNSPQPLLHYPGFFAPAEKCSAKKVNETFQENGWETQWIFRYGQTQRAHYHSGVHECMAVLSGTATIRFGVADTSEDMGENTFGSAREEGGIELQARAGDVFILPAGMAHKTYNTQPSAEFTLLTPGDGHHIAGGDVAKALEETKLSGFTMIGAYPRGGGYWNSQKGGEDSGAYEKIWAVPKPEADPLIGKLPEGLGGLWK